MGRHQQQPTDAVERIAGPSAVAGGLLLDSPADVVDGGVGQLRDMEPVHHQGGVVQADVRVGQCRPVGRRRVERDDAYRIAPCLGLGGQPRLQDPFRASGDDVERAARGQVHQHRHEPAATAGAGPVHHLLVHPQRHAQPRLGRVDALGVEGLGGRVVDRTHHRLPADPERSGHRRDGVAVLAHLPGRLGTGTLGQRLELLNEQLSDYDDAIASTLAEHPDARILTSFPGVGPVLAAVLLAEIGEDRGRFPNPRVLLAEAGLAPVTRSSGRSRSVRFRYAANSRLREACMWWAFNSLKVSPWANEAFRHVRDRRGQRYHRALRGLGARWARVLWRCWTDRSTYDPGRHRAAATRELTTA